MGRDSVRYTTLRTPEGEASHLCLDCTTPRDRNGVRSRSPNAQRASADRIAALKFSQKGAKMTVPDPIETN